MKPDLECPERDRCLGALVGLATGDALGTTLEFKAPGTFAPITDMVGGGPFRLEPGQWTDDTSMALCLGESILQEGFNPADQMTRYVHWWREGYMSSTGTCFDIGNTVSAALRRFRQDGNPFAGSTDPYSAGNGSLMRLAPVPIHYRDDAKRATHLAGESSRTTHGAREAVDACRYFAGLIVGAIQGTPKDELLSPAYAPGWRWSATDLSFKIHEIAVGSFRDPGRTIRGTGYVVDSLEAALWAFATTDDFRSGALAAANLGDDADTTAAIYAQIAGAHYGLQCIPTDWREKLHQGDDIAAMASRLMEPPTT